MDKQILLRINELAKKKRESGLTEAEQKEQKRLYSVYLGEIRAQFDNTLNNVKLKQPDGSTLPFKKAFKKTANKPDENK